MKMSINRALTQLKLLDKQINTKLESAKFASLVTADTTADTIKEIEKEYDSAFQSIEDLIKRRKLIKDAIVISNANTKVTIGKEEMTVAEAIEYKISIGYKKMLHTKLNSAYVKHASHAERENEKIKEMADRQATEFYKDKAGSNESGYKNFVDQYVNTRSLKALSVSKVETVLEKLGKEIQEFESEVDFVLSESNTVTVIEVTD